MNFLIKIIISSFAVVITSYLLPGVMVDDYLTAILVAIVLALLNTVLKPILVILTIPITVITLGLFLIVINALIILLASEWVPGFTVGGFGLAILFSIILSIITYLLEALGRQ
ncbi:MAG: phage holin family protein [Bacteroidales bacterium]|nr:phage holin family protein [Bacteroidales bacterium]